MDNFKLTIVGIVPANIDSFGVLTSINFQSLFPLDSSNIHLEIAENEYEYDYMFSMFEKKIKRMIGRI